MTPDCIKKVEGLYAKNEVFEDLSIEQLLYSAIKGTGLSEVKMVLDDTDWSKWLTDEDLE